MIVVFWDFKLRFKEAKQNIIEVRKRITRSGLLIYKKSNPPHTPLPSQIPT